MPASEVLEAIMESWIRDWIEVREGFPGRRRNVFAAFKSVRLMFQAEERVYNSLITAKRSSTATEVSCSERGADSFRGLCPTIGMIDERRDVDTEGLPFGEPLESTVLTELRGIEFSVV